MRIALTGASGFIGRHLTATAEHEWVRVSRREGGFAISETKLDALVHLAGESLMGFWSAAKKQRMWQSRVELTKRLVEQLGTWKAENRPEVLVCASGAGFYGDRGEEPLDEFSTAGGGFLAELCIEWEKAARIAESLGMRVVTLRTGMVLGADGGAFPLLRRVFGFGLGGRLGSGRQFMPWIHVDDAVALILKAAGDSTLRGPLNLTAPQAVTNAEFTQALARVLKRPAFFHAPAFALKLLLRDMATEMFLGGQRVQPRVALEHGHVFKHATLESALRALVG
jgi:uncharacterized protein (TIGR01777 family)